MMKMHSLRPILDEAFEVFGDKSQYVVAAPQYRAAANTAMGCKNANLSSEMTRLLRLAGVSGCPRLFHYGMLAKLARIGPESGARHPWNRARRSIYQMTTSREQARGEGNCGRATERGKEARGVL